MTSRFATSCCTLLILAAVLPATTNAQPAIPSPSFKIERTEGTPSENTLIQTLSSRLNAKASDAAFWKRVNDAVGQKNVRSAKSMIAEVAQVPADQVWIGSQSKSIGSINPSSQGIFRLASYERPAVTVRERANPFAVVFSAGGTWWCVGTVAGCTAVSTKMGIKGTWS